MIEPLKPHRFDFTALHLREAVQYLQTTFGAPPSLALVLGSGFAEFTRSIESPTTIATTQVPHMVGSSVLGHSGQLLRGRLGPQDLMVVSGRVHGYEGHSPEKVVYLVRALCLWGVKKFILTNASGSTDRRFAPGSLVFLKDQINLTGMNPLVGPELLSGPRFPDMSEPFSHAWRKRAITLARRQKIAGLKEGVYIGVLGPSFETAAEIRAYRQWGAQIVGMSTVWEVIALRQLGAEILGLSCVTNYGTGVTKNRLTHDDVLKTSQRVMGKLTKLLKILIHSEKGPAARV